MIEVPLRAVPAQEFTVQIDQRRFEMHFKDAVSCVAVDLVVDGETVLLGQRVVAGTPLIPYEYLEAGNFLLLTDDEALPDWREFGVSQTLLYLSDAETTALRAQ